MLSAWFTVAVQAWSAGAFCLAHLPLRDVHICVELSYPAAFLQVFQCLPRTLRKLALTHDPLSYMNTSAEVAGLTDRISDAAQLQATGLRSDFDV